MKILPNGIAVIEGDTHHAKWVEESGNLVHDPWMAEQICRHIKPGDVVIEGGANIGTLTRAILHAGATVITFEPNPEARACLEFNCRSRSLQSMCLALCENGSARLRLHRNNNAGASWIEEVSDIKDTTEFPISIDQFPKEQLQLIKLDIEGYEAKAIRGARETITRFKPVLILEVNSFALERAGDSEDILLTLVEELGYSWRILQENCKRGDPQYDIEALPR